MEENEIGRKNKLLNKAYYQEWKYLLPLLCLPLFYALYAIFTCGSDCSRTKLDNASVSLLVFFCSIAIILVAHAIYEGITLSSKYQATHGMRKVGIYVTKEDKSKHSFISTLVVYFPILLWLVVTKIMNQVRSYIIEQFDYDTFFWFEMIVYALLIFSFIFLIKKATKSRRYFVGHKP